LSKIAERQDKSCESIEAQGGPMEHTTLLLTVIVKI
jgi:hypothetical protein